MKVCGCRFSFFNLPNFTFLQLVFLVYQKCTLNYLNPQPGVWIKELKFLFLLSRGAGGSGGGSRGRYICLNIYV